MALVGTSPKQSIATVRAGSLPLNSVRWRLSEELVHSRQQQLTAWCIEAQDILYAYGTCFAPVNSTIAADRVGFVLNQLHLRAALTSISALKLVTELRLWDCEILLRTVVEGSLKFAFISSASGDERDARAREFTDTLRDIAALKRHRRALIALSQLPADGPQWQPIRDVLLTSDEVDELEAEYPKASRDALERKWGFARMVETLAKSGPRYAALTGLLYNYGMASHSTHLDGDAVLMMWERERRPEHRLHAVELAHGARLIGDTLTFADLRTSEFIRIHGADANQLGSVRKRREDLTLRLNGAHDLFHAAEYSESESAGAA